MGGPGDDGEPGVGDAGDQGAGLGGPGDLVLGADEHERGDADAVEGLADVEDGEGLAGGDVAGGVGRTDHLHGPVDDGGLRAGEERGEPLLGGGAGHRLQAVGPHDDAPLPELVGGAEPGRGGDQGERGDPVGRPQYEVEADGPAEGAARVAEALDPERVEGGEQPVPQLGHGAEGLRGRAAVPGEVEAYDPPVPREFGDLPVPHVERGPQGGSQDQDRGVLPPVDAVLQGVRWCLAHPLDPLISHGLSHRRVEPSGSRPPAGCRAWNRPPHRGLTDLVRSGRPCRATARGSGTPGDSGGTPTRRAATFWPAAARAWRWIPSGSAGARSPVRT